MDFQQLIFSQSQGVATIAFNNPATYNALNRTMLEEMVQALEACRDDHQVRAVVVTGAGPAFCSGADLRAAREHLAGGGRLSIYLLDLIKLFHRFVTDIRHLPKPVIAAINGPAAGAGFSMALACDLRIASQKAVFRQAYTQIALVPDGGWTVFLPRLGGLGLASELVLLNRPIDAEEALRLGLVHRVVPEGELVVVVGETAQRLAAGPTSAFGRAKALLNASVLGDLEAQLERERLAAGAAADTEDFREGISAFLEKRQPRYRGR